MNNEEKTERVDHHDKVEKVDKRVSFLLLERVYKLIISTKSGSE